MTDRRLVVALLVPLGVLAACSGAPASNADTPAAPASSAVATGTPSPTVTARPSATHRHAIGGAAPSASASPRPRATPTGHPKATHTSTHASPTPAPKHPRRTAHPPTHQPVTHPPVVVSVPCPPKAEILRAAKAGNGGALPPDVRVVDTRCTARYVAGLLSSGAGAGSMLLAWTGGTLHLVTVGGVICPNPTVHRLPLPIRRFLHC